MRKIVGMAVALVSALSLSVTVFAAGGISSSEQAILDKAYSVMSGFTFSASQQQKVNDMLAQVMSYLEANDLSDDQIAIIQASMDNALATVSKYGMDFTKLTAAQRQELLASATRVLQAGAAAAGVNLSMDTDTSVDVVSESEGTVVGSTSDTIKKTGFSIGTTAAVLLAISAALTGCIVYSGKRGLFETRQADL
ncbi:MAG: hypothetical protein ACK5MN_00700 [Lachnospiraceae bacterium]